jgi:DNA-binding HxlR family transcriptional regulator
MDKVRNYERRREENKNKACMIQDGDSTICIDSSLPILNLIGKKYTMLVLGVIGNTGKRKNFNEILIDIPFSSSTIISKRLKELQELDLIVKHKGPEGVVYSLTELGWKVREMLIPFLRFVERRSEIP